MEGQKMLVLCRKPGERVVIGNEIEVTVLEVRGDRVKLGFRGPAEVPIHRHELYVKLSDCHPATV
jgi:carbon storage regulator